LMANSNLVDCCTGEMASQPRFDSAIIE
jgi:hypothetical protein